ncbi:MAG: C25 family cysteine peptidase [Anaerolineae bacterium]
MRHWILGVALALLLAACAPPPAPPPVIDPGVYFVEVAGDGVVWLGPETLSTIGVDAGRDAPPAVRISHSDHVLPTLSLSTEAGWGLLFFAPDGATRYADRTHVRVVVEQPGQPMDTVDVPRPGSLVDGARVSVRRERDERYLPQAETVRPWFWEPLYAPDAVTHTWSLTSAVPGPVTVTLHLWSHTALPPQPDHRLVLHWDGRPVGEWTWDGIGLQQLSASWNVEVPGQHTLAIETPALPEVDAAVVWIDGWDATSLRRVAAGGSLWQAVGDGLRMADIPADARLLDVTDPFAPVDRGSVPADGVIATVAGHRYWAGRPSAAREPLAIRPAERLDLDALQGIDYLALAPRAFHGSLEPLLDHRRGQGLIPALLSVQAVYDALGAGQPDPAAIQALVEVLPDLRYLLVVGDGTVEPGGYEGDVGGLRVVTPLTRTRVLGETPADGLLGRGQVAVGRLPAASAGELTAMVDKIIRWEDWETNPPILLLSDDESEFGDMTEDLVALMPEAGTMRWVDSGAAGSREEVLEILRQGPTWVNFSGHGSLTHLCDEGLLTLEDGAAWREPAVVVAWTCLAAHFAHPAQASMGEVWLREPRGGVVAFLGPVGETTTGEQRPFAEAFYEALPEAERLGDAWLVAQQTGQSSDVAVGYLILGDPALLLPWR